MLGVDSISGIVGRVAQFQVPRPDLIVGARCMLTKRLNLSKCGSLVTRAPESPSIKLETHSSQSPLNVLGRNERVEVD